VDGRPDRAGAPYGTLHDTVGDGELFPAAVKPKLVDAPPARLPLKLAFFTVTAPLVPVLTPFHNELMDCPLWRLSLTVQLLMLDPPLFLTVTDPLKPLFHELLVE
jgi:hypothetical protein